VRPPERVLAVWAAEHGRTDVAGDAFREHVDAVLRRIKASDACSDYNGPHQRMAEGAAKLGYAMRRALLTSTRTATTPRAPATPASATPAAPSRARCGPSCRTPTTAAHAWWSAAGPSGC
jgi:hypothetical protein